MVRRISLLALALTVLMGVPARAGSASLDQARQQVRSQQQGPLLELLRQADERRRSIDESIAALGTQINDLQRRLDALKPELDAAKHQRDLASLSALAAQENYQTSKRNLSTNALSLYSTGGWSDAIRLITTDDLATFASAKIFMESVVDSGTKIVYEFQKSRNEVRAEQARVNAQTEAILNHTKQLESEQQRLIALTESKQQASNEITNAEMARAQAIAALTKDPSGFDLIVKSYSESTQAIRLLVATAQAGQPIQSAQSSSVWWPVQGPVTTPFGPRIHPIFHYKSFHTGIDISAEYGQPIRAAQPGVVVDVVYLGAFGLVTVIDHGFSLATMYAHQSRSLVHPGERVQAGQIIGAVGCTGWCTGPHIHFEVWSRSNPVDPMGWLS